ncbi:MAG TPA: hypothetical protein DCG48_09300 [Rhodospirillaceae bacterium]|nr:hypothetical protein [Rhodospirillaceae bacterium]|tara:strand:- start:329 stop:910 length:582 start_codon:yes stop_codon:yes gene_type:complete
MTDADPLDQGREPAASDAISVDDAAQRIDAAMARIDAMDLDGALSILAEIEAGLRFPKDPSLRVQWARCLDGLGFIDLMDAKELRAAGEAAVPGAEDPDHKFTRGLKQALAKFDQALANQMDPTYRNTADGNKAYVLALLDRQQEARTLFRRLLKAGGKEVYDGQMRDTGRYPIHEDRAVRRMLDDLWEEIDK